MDELRIRSVPDEIVARIDIITKEKGYSSRSELVIEILKKYCTLGDDFIIENLPTTIRILVNDAINKDRETLLQMQLKSFEIMTANVTLLSEIRDIMNGEMWEKSENNVDISLISRRKPDIKLISIRRYNISLGTIARVFLFFVDINLISRPLSVSTAQS